MNIETRIALLAGGDLDERERGEIERRLATCPDARHCHEEMSESLSVLRACRDGRISEVDEARSLWPRVARRLPSQRRPGPIESLRPWVPALTVAALVLALATVATTPPRSKVPFAGAWPAADDGSARTLRPFGDGDVNFATKQRVFEIPHRELAPRWGPSADSDGVRGEVPYDGRQPGETWSPTGPPSN